MNDIIKHIQKESYKSLLFEYAAGNLCEMMDIFVSSHLTLSPRARDYIYECEQIAGNIMEDMEITSYMSEDSLLNVLNIIEQQQEQKNDPKPERYNKKNGLNFPEPLSSHIDKSINNVKWAKNTYKIEYIEIETFETTIVANIFRLAAGHKHVTHTHNKTEYTLILDGSFIDEYGEYKNGDIIIMEKDTQHTPIANNNNGCTYLCVYI